MSARDVFWLVFTAISLLAIILTIYDKQQAIRHRYRVPEATLLWVGFVGGACAMLLTMLTIRHKTRHAKFMIGLPAFIVLQIGAAVFLQWKLHLPVVPFLFG